MSRFQSPDHPNASLERRQVLIGGSSAFLAACQPKTMAASTTPPLDMTRLNAEIEGPAARARPGHLSVGLMNLENGETWTFEGARPMPMQSVFKLLLGAAALAEVDANRLRLDEGVVLTGQMLSPPYSSIAAAWPARKDYTAGQLLVAAVGESDNTAADVLMKRIGGPGALTGWLQAKRLTEIRVDRYERQLQPESVGLASFRPAWKGEAAFDAVTARVPPERRRAAMRAYLNDPRDTATARGMLLFLQMLQAGELVSAASTRLLLQVMTDNPSAPNRLQAALPKGARLAHKTGSGRREQGISSAVNDVGIVTLADSRAYAVAVFLAGSALDGDGADALITDVGRILIGALD